MNLITTPRRALLGALSASALMLAAAVPAHAQDELIVVEPARSTMFVNGGIGQDEQQAMRKVAADYPLRMVFSQHKDGEFVADVRLLITDLKGSPYLQLDRAGPMTDVMLPKGKYRVTATYQGKTETHEVTIAGKAGQDVYFNWGNAKT